MFLNIFPSHKCQFCLKLYNIEHHLNHKHIFEFHLNIPVDHINYTLLHSFNNDFYDYINWFCFCCFPAVSFPKLNYQKLTNLLQNHQITVYSEDFSWLNIPPHYHSSYTATGNIFYGFLGYAKSLESQQVRGQDYNYIYTILATTSF